MGDEAAAVHPRAEPAGSVRHLRRARPDLTVRPLPRQLTRFVGRERELGELVALVGRHRMVVLTGAAGCGKTRLSIEVATRAAVDFPDGVMFVELASLEVGDSIAGALAHQLGTSPSPDMDPVEALAAELADSRALLVLDNCEHLTAAVSAVTATLVTTCPHLAVLATSRQDLDVRGAASWQVPPLAVAGDGSESEAVELFADRAALASRTFQLTAANRPVIREICEQLDGLPFAIELAASRVPTLGPRQILERIEDRFDLLGRETGTSDRHDTLGALVDWSFALLDENGRNLLQRLSVFAGSFDLEAVEAVTGDVDLGGRELVETLGDLIRRSLVTADEVDGRARYRLLRTIAEFARERLAVAGEEDHWRERHLHWCLAVSQPGATPFGPGPERQAWLRRLRAHLDELRAAIRFGLATDRATAALALAWRTALLSELFPGVGHDTRPLLDAALARTEGLVSTDRAIGLLVTGSNCETTGAPEAARHHYEQALVLAQQLDDPLLVGMAQWNLGDAAAGTAADEGVVENHYQHSLEQLLRVDAVREADLVRRRLAAVMLRRGETSRARALLESCVSIPGAAAHATTLVAWAAIELQEGDDDACRELLDAALATCRDEDPGTSPIACALVNLADHRRTRDGAAAARDLYREAIDHAHSADLRALTLRSLDGLAAASAELGQSEDALRLFAAHECVATGGPRGQACAEVSALLAPQLREVREAEVTRLRAQVGEHRAATLVREGSAMDLDAAVAAARAATDLVDDPGTVDVTSRQASSRPVDEPAGSLVRLGDVWEFDFDDRRLTVRDAKGIRYLAQLLSQPDREFHVLDLGTPAAEMSLRTRPVDLPVRQGPGHAGTAIDATARRHYQERVDDLRSQIDDATTLGDAEAAARAREELDAIAHELSSAYGLSGRPRTVADPVERARKAVSKCLRTSITQLQQDHPGLGRHLDAAVRTGRYCSYQPPEPTSWSVHETPPA